MTDRRFARYFRAPGRYEDLSEDARDWWESLATPVTSQAELDERYPIEEMEVVSG